MLNLCGQLCHAMTDHTQNSDRARDSIQSEVNMNELCLHFSRFPVKMKEQLKTRTISMLMKITLSFG
jgi:hypothetical protein